MGTIAYFQASAPSLHERQLVKNKRSRTPEMKFTTGFETAQLGSASASSFGLLHFHTTNTTVGTRNLELDRNYGLTGSK